MQLFKYLPLAFAALAVATSHHNKGQKPTADTIVADLKLLQQRTITLNQTAAPYQGGKGSLGQALDINRASNDVVDALEQTIDDGNNVAPFTTDDAIKVGVAVNDLNPNVISTLDTFKSKRQAFDNRYHLSPIVRKSLVKQKGLTQDLSNALVAKTPDAFKDFARQLSKPVLDKFDEVIAVYSS